MIMDMAILNTEQLKKHVFYEHPMLSVFLGTKAATALYLAYHAMKDFRKLPEMKEPIEEISDKVKELSRKKA